MKQILTTLLLALSVSVSAQESPQGLTFSIEEAIDYALGSNINQKVLRINTQSAGEEVAQSKRDLLPNLSASLSQSFDYSHSETAGGGNASGNYSVSTQMTLYNGGQNWNAIRRNKLLYHQSDTKVAQAQNTLTLGIIQSFLSVLMNDELLKYQQEVVRKSEEQVKQGKTQYAAGQILESDYLLLEAQYATDRSNVVNTQVSRNNALLQLKNHLSLDPLTDLQITPPDTASTLTQLDLPELQTVIDETLSWLPDIQLSNQNIELASLQTKISRGAYQPTISLGGSIGTGYYSNGTGFGSQLKNGLGEQIGITVSIPLWDRGKTRSTVRKNQLAETQAKLEAEQTRYDVRKELEQEYQNVVSKHSQFLASTTKHYAQGEVFRTYGVKFEAGSITAVDLLQQQTNYLSALNEYIQNKYSYLLNRKVIDVYMGKEITL